MASTPGWASYPGARGPFATLFLEAFGHLERDPGLPGVVSDDEDLYSVFLARSELMGWSRVHGSSSSPRFAEPLLPPLLWHHEEAELTFATEPSRIGFVQVGLDDGVEAAIALPALLQCFDDSLDRFGAAELSGLQVTGTQLRHFTGPAAGLLLSTRNWFRTVSKGPVQALLTFSNEMTNGRSEADLTATIQAMTHSLFEFGLPVAVPPQHAISVPPEAPIAFTPPFEPAGLGLPVTLPEWSASAIGLLLALVIDEMRYHSPETDRFVVRISQFPEPQSVHC